MSAPRDCIFGGASVALKIILGYGVASVSRIDKIIGLFCKRDLLKRRYSAQETYDFIDPTNHSHPISKIHTLSKEPYTLLQYTFSPPSRSGCCGAKRVVETGIRGPPFSCVVPKGHPPIDTSLSVCVCE